MLEGFKNSDGSIRHIYSTLPDTRVRLHQRFQIPNHESRVAPWEGIWKSRLATVHWSDIRGTSARRFPARGRFDASTWHSNAERFQLSGEQVSPDRAIQRAGIAGEQRLALRKRAGDPKVNRKQVCQA